MTHWQLYVCGETSWWRGHALALEHSAYNNPPCTKTDEAQQFSTVWGCGGVAGIGESCWVSSSVEVGCCRLKMFSSWWFSSSKLLMQPLSCSTCCSSAEILWTSDSQLSAHWLLVWQSYEGGRRKLANLLHELVQIAYLWTDGWYFLKLVYYTQFTCSCSHGKYCICFHHTHGEIC